jgi:hypothetical protein
MESVPSVRQHLGVPSFRPQPRPVTHYDHIGDRIPTELRHTPHNKEERRQSMRSNKSTHTLRRAVDFSRGTLLFLVQLYGNFFFGKRLFT